jgi:60 kDa SS-A/Ro ribonucleoprotein
LPEVVSAFEAFKQDNTLPVPNVPFRALTNCGLTTKHWTELAQKMPWNTLRQNINTLLRNDVFKDERVARAVAARIGDAQAVRDSKVFPYQLLTTYKYTTDAPTCIQNALQDALEIATENVPSLDMSVSVCIDLSGSMSSAVTGDRGSVTSKTTCIDVASLIAAVILRTNPESDLIGWASNVGHVKLNSRDSVMSNSQKLAASSIHFGGGTNSQLALQLLNQEGAKRDLIIYVSDNQSWIGNGSCGGTAMAEQWKVFKKKNPRAKLICIDVQPYGSTQVQDDKDVLNIGGFSDEVFSVIARFAHGDSAHFVDVVNSVEL